MTSRKLLRVGSVLLLLGAAAQVCVPAQSPSQTATPATPQAPPQVPPQIDVQRTPAPERRIPQQLTSGYGAVQGLILDTAGRPVPGVMVSLEGGPPGAAVPSSGDGIFRLLRIPPGTYDLVFTRQGAAPLRRPAVELHAGEVLSIEVHLPVVAGNTSTALSQSPMETLEPSQYKELSRRPDSEGTIIAATGEVLPAYTANFQPQRDRWDLQLGGYRRYLGAPDAPFVMGHWYDPFNRNRYKGDKPIHGNTFFMFTGDSITAVDGRRLPTPAGISTAEPGEPGFFGKGGQFLYEQTFRTTFDLFHGDTESYKPVDWRIRATPAGNVNVLLARENQVVSPNDLHGTTRFDGHFGFQELFGEVKLHDLSPNYDFVNLRVGIQQFVSDFRGFVFADEQPAVRIFGNYASNRFQYNLVGFDLLEKDTNSGLNKVFSRRGREVAIANIYIQDFFVHGYTAQFSYHFQRDNASIHYDDNGRLTRPTPVGSVIENLTNSSTKDRIDADYFGWTGDGHFGRLNITHAFYQVLGHETFNNIAGGPVGINAQLAASEFSVDHDWLRFRTSFLYASGDSNPRDGTGRGFSSIVDGVAFAGGEFSFFNREGIPLTRALVALTAPDSFLPDLRASKDEGQSNFVNPGVFLYNAGVDALVLPKLKLFGNVNFLQFDRTEALQFLLQQNAIRRTIGLDYGLGAIYRPFLSDNIVIQAGITGLTPGAGLRDIYTSQTLISAFGVVRFQF
jgi:hypothetical protein